MLRPAAVSACAAVSLLALTSCSSGHPARSADTGAISQQPQPTRSAGSPSPSSQAPLTIRISSHYAEVFATTLPADPARAAVISGFRQSQVLWDKSTVALHLVGMTTEYVTGRALTALNTVLRSFTKNNIVPVGVDRLFDTKITSLTASSATVTSCDDGSGYNVANRTTGQTESPAPASQQYAFAVFTMSRVDGRWASSSVSAISYPDKRVKACIHDAATL
jgi:hypothetical protein